MGRKNVERHNDEFIGLWKESGLKQREIAELLGVKLITVKSWCVNEDSQMSNGCPKWRVDMFKIVLKKKLADLTDGQRERVLEIFRNMEGGRM